MSAPESTVIHGRGQPCAWCGEPSEGRYVCPAERVIGAARGPELPLCNAHGQAAAPTIFEVWRQARERGTA